MRVQAGQTTKKKNRDTLYVNGNLRREFLQNTYKTPTNAKTRKRQLQQVLETTGLISESNREEISPRDYCGPTFDFLKSQNLVVFHDFLDSTFIKF